MRWLTTALRVCLGLTALCRLSQAVTEKVCADLVGTGGVGVRIWPTLKASPIRLQHQLTFRLVQINWEADEIFEGDWVGVFPKDPRPPARRTNPLGLPTPQNRSKTPWEMPAPLYWDTPYATYGQLTSNFSQGRTELEKLASGGCVGVWVAFIRNGVAIAADCLASHPNWLWQNRDVLGSRSLRSLVIPGTHNSGSYSLKDEDDVVSAWVVCQDEDILSQLLYGIRYLDLRVAYYPHSPELLWVNHDLVQWRPLVDILNEVQTFLTLSRDPIIIDIHRTPVGFEFTEAVPLLLSLLNNTFGEDFLPDRYRYQVTLDQIWSTGKRIILSYIDADVADEEDWIWPPLPQAWANAQMLGDLQHFLDGQMTLRKSSPRIWAAMAHLTPSFWDVILRSHEGVRGLADHANRPVSTWLRTRWAHLANIVANDFFRGSNLINISIRTNLALSVCPSGDYNQRSNYSYKAPSFLRRSTELPGQFSSSISQPRQNFTGATRTKPLPNTTLPPLLKTLSTIRPSDPMDTDSSSDLTGSSDSETRQFPQENNTGRRKSISNSAPEGLSINFPIHSLLDIFGFNTTNTSTINSRLLPRDQDQYDQNGDYPSIREPTHMPGVEYDYDPDLFTSSNSQNEGGLFITSSQQLPLILETSMSIALQEDSIEDDLQNSGDIPFRLFAPSRSDATDGASSLPTEKEQQQQVRPVRQQENAPVSIRKNSSLKKPLVGVTPSQGQDRPLNLSESIDSSLSISSPVINQQTHSSITVESYPSDKKYMSERLRELS